jgi:hypothetical protein
MLKFITIRLFREKKKIFFQAQAGKIKKSKLSSDFEYLAQA